MDSSKEILEQIIDLKYIIKDMTQMICHLADCVDCLIDKTSIQNGTACGTNITN